MSNTPVTLTVRTEFQFDEVNSSCVVLSSTVCALPIEEMTPSPVSVEESDSVTLSVGAVARLTVNVATAPDSSVSPDTALMLKPPLPVRSRFFRLTSGGSTKRKRRSVVVLS